MIHFPCKCSGLTAQYGRKCAGCQIAEEMEKVVREAVLAERERAAEEADSHCCEGYCCPCQRRIAAAIRGNSARSEATDAQPS